MSSRAVIYARVSTLHQKEKGWSLPSQIEACEEYCYRNDFTVVETLTDGESGKKSDREGLDRVRALIRDGAASELVIYQIDRAFRDTIGWLLLLRDVRSAGATIHIAARGRAAGQTPEERMLDMFEAGLAEMELERIRERTMRGRLRKAKAGRYPGQGQARYGYQRVGEKRDVRLEPHPLTAQYARLIWQWFLFGDERGTALGVQDIIRKLELLGAPAPADLQPRKNRKRAPGKWNATSIYDILKDPIYTGVYYAYREKVEGTRIVKRPRSEWIPIEVPALIPREWFDLAQRKLSIGRAQSRRNSRHPYLVSRYVRCACGYHIQGKPTWAKGKVYLYYRCNGRDETITALRCSLPAFRARVLDDAVWQFIVERAQDEKTLEDTLEIKQGRTKYLAEQREAQRRRYEEALRDIDEQRRRLVDAVAIGALRLEDVKRKNEELDERRAEIEKLIEAPDAGVMPITPERAEQVRALAEQIRQNHSRMTFEQRRAAVEIALDDAIVVSLVDGVLTAKIETLIGSGCLQLE